MNQKKIQRIKSEMKKENIDPNSAFGKHFLKEFKALVKSKEVK